jgi:hypothetical protein
VSWPELGIGLELAALVAERRRGRVGAGAGRRGGVGRGVAGCLDYLNKKKKTKKTQHPKKKHKTLKKSKKKTPKQSKKKKTQI